MNTLPPQFSDLEPYVADWALPSTRARVEKRVRTPYTDIERFYHDMSARMEAVMDFLSDYLPHEADLPTDVRVLLHLAKAYTEAAMSVELLKAPDEPMVIPIERLTLWP